MLRCRKVCTCRLGGARIHSEMSRVVIHGDVETSAETENWRRRIEEELRGTVKGEAAVKALEEISGQSSREGYETNEVELGGRVDGCANHNFHNHHDQHHHTP